MFVFGGLILFKELSFLVIRVGFMGKPSNLYFIQLEVK